MVTEKELRKAIDELEEEPGSYKGCAILAALYALKDRYYGGGDFSESLSGGNASSRFSSFSNVDSGHVSVMDSTINDSGDSEFLRAVRGKSWEEVLPVVDELVTAVKALQPQLYGAFLRRF